MNPEHGPQVENSVASKAEIDALGKERLQDLSERSPEVSNENQSERAERARELLKQHEVVPEPGKASEKDNSRTNLSGHLNRILNYNQTLSSVQRRLKPASRQFSKIIHTPAVEKTSEALEK